MIDEVIGWKFNHQEGMECTEIDGVMTITAFPGGIPSQSEQDLWTQEYNTFIATGGLKEAAANIEERFNDTLKAFALVILDEINLLRVQGGLTPRTINQLKSAIKGKL